MSKYKRTHGPTRIHRHNLFRDKDHKLILRRLSFPLISVKIVSAIASARLDRVRRRRRDVSLQHGVNENTCEFECVACMCVCVE